MRSTRQAHDAHCPGSDLVPGRRGNPRPSGGGGRAIPSCGRVAALLASCLGALGLSGLAGCVGVAVSVEEPFPLEDLDTIEPPPTRYLIQPGDELEIKFFHTPDLDLTVPVRPDGYVSVPFGEEVLAAGHTAEELDDQLTARFAKELRSPEVTVIVRTFTNQVVHVGGEVDKPGVLPLTNSMTVVQALFQAGGYLDTARLSEVILMRRTPDGHHVVVPLDIEKALDGRDPTQDVRLRPYDAVFVPKTTIANVNVWVDQYIRRMIPINFGYRFAFP